MPINCHDLASYRAVFEWRSRWIRLSNLREVSDSFRYRRQSTIHGAAPSMESDAALERRGSVGLDLVEVDGRRRAAAIVEQRDIEGPMVLERALNELHERDG